MSVTTEDDIKFIQSMYKVPEGITMCKLEPREIPSHGRIGEIAIVVAAFGCGLRLPMAPVLHRFFRVALLHLF